MTLLFFDTETTGLPISWNLPMDSLGNWPRLVQLAWIITDDHGSIITEQEALIRPDGFTIPRDATCIHGITQDDAMTKGQDLRSVLQLFSLDADDVTTLIAHNLQFDKNVVGAELIRTNQKHNLWSKSQICTMKSSTDYLKIPGKYGYKYPSLAETYYHLFHKLIQDAHHALGDARTCKQIYFELRRLGVINE